MEVIETDTRVFLVKPQPELTSQEVIPKPFPAWIVIGRTPEEAMEREAKRHREMAEHHSKYLARHTEQLERLEVLRERILT